MIFCQSLCDFGCKEVYDAALKTSLRMLWSQTILFQGLHGRHQLQQLPTAHQVQQ